MFPVVTGDALESGVLVRKPADSRPPVITFSFITEWRVTCGSSSYSIWLNLQGTVLHYDARQDGAFVPSPRKEAPTAQI